MQQLLTMLEIVVAWIIIIGIFNYMIDDGLGKELRHLLEDIRRKVRL